MQADIQIAIESPRQDDVIELIRLLDEYQNLLYTPEGNHLLSIDELDQPNIKFWVARQDGVAIACGALRTDKEGWGEVKRMFVLPVARGLKLGRGILNLIEEEAKHKGLTCLRLETGPRQPEALGLYKSAGFVERGPFGNYSESPSSVFMEKIL